MQIGPTHRQNNKRVCAGINASAAVRSTPVFQPSCIYQNRELQKIHLWCAGGVKEKQTYLLSKEIYLQASSGTPKGWGDLEGRVEYFAIPRVGLDLNPRHPGLSPLLAVGGTYQQQQQNGA